MVPNPYKPPEPQTEDSPPVCYCTDVGFLSGSPHFHFEGKIKVKEKWNDADRNAYQKFLAIHKDNDE